MKTEDLPKNPLAVTISILDSKWKILIIAQLLDGTKRFNELKKSLKGITQKVLTSKLRELEADGFLSRKSSHNRVEYFLTDTGYSLRPVILSLYDWGKDYKKYVKLLKNLNPKS